MARIRIPHLAALALASLSCGVLPQRAALPAQASLPAVSAPPPAADQPVPPDPAVQALVRELESRHTGLSRQEVHGLAETLVAESRSQDIALDLVLAVMHVESGYYNFAVSPVGALGLMQIMPATGEESARELGIQWRGPRTLFDPEVNVRIGVWYLRQLRDRYGHIDVALAAYNWGPQRIDWRLRTGRALPTLYPSQVRDAWQERDAAGATGRGRV
jgi:peptidoglycan lytic transglycosylase